MNTAFFELGRHFAAEADRWNKIVESHREIGKVGQELAKHARDVEASMAPIREIAQALGQQIALSQELNDNLSEIREMGRQMGIRLREMTRFRPIIDLDMKEIANVLKQTREQATWRIRTPEDIWNDMLFPELDEGDAEEQNLVKVRNKRPIGFKHHPRKVDR